MSATEARTATVQRHSAPSGNRDSDYFQPVCECGWEGAACSNRTVEGRCLAERRAAEQVCRADPTPQDVLAEIVARFPDRDRRGHVVGWYVVTPRGDRLAGPFPTEAEAEAECGRVSWYAIVVCGWVFTPAGTIVSAS